MLKRKSVEDLLLLNAPRRKNIGFTDLEILFLVDKSERAIQREIKNLLKWNRIEAILLFLDSSNDKNFLILYRKI